jgi:hypothetical protein
MNLKTTLALLVVLGCGVGLYYTGLALPPTLLPQQEEGSAADAGSLAVLEGLDPDAFTTIEVRSAAGRTVLRRAADKSWVMPGNWPTRAAEVKQLTDLLGGLRSRFRPKPVRDDDDLKAVGLNKPAVTVEVRAGEGKEPIQLAFAEAPPAAGSTPFDRPTYLQVGDRPEVVRLGPGVVAQLDRPADYYQQRRLFPVERVAREGKENERVNRLAGQRLEVREKGKLKYALRRGPDGWELAEPYPDALDPAAGNTLLEAVPDVWAERFLPADEPASPRAMGLVDPDRVVAVTRADGGTVTLEVGKPVPAARERLAQFFLGLTAAVLEVGKPPPDPTPNRRVYARLRGSDRTFEINPDKLNAVFVNLETLRDNQLARFKAEDAREIEITTDKGKIVLRNDAPPGKPGDKTPAKGDWKLLTPTPIKAEPARVERLVSTLANLSAVDVDVAHKLRAAQAAALPALAGSHAALLSGWLLEPGRLAEAYGFRKPAGTVRVVVEEHPAGKPPRRRTVTITLGRHDPLTKKLYARSQGWPRINEIDDGLAALVLGQTSLDYRGRRVLDFVSADVDQVEVRWPRSAPAAACLLGLDAGVPGYTRMGMAAWAGLAGQGPYLALKRTAGGWALAAPVKTEADAGKAADLADRLGKLEVLAFVADRVPARQMQQQYGLGVAALVATVKFTDPKKPPLTLYVGNERPGAAGRYARLGGTDEVFVVADALADQLGRDSLAYRPALLWQVAAGDVTRLRVEKAGEAPYELNRKGEGWQVSGPFSVAAPGEVVGRLTAALAAPRAAGYRAHAVSDFAPFGLDRPPLKVTLTTKNGTQHALSLGDRTTAGAPGRLARTAGGAALFVVDEALARAADQSALDFLDKDLLKIDSNTITSFERKRGDSVLALAKGEDGWQLVRPEAGPADEEKTPGLLRELAALRAERVAAYEPKDASAFGLDKPIAVITIKSSADGKTAENVLELGKAPPEGGGRRFVRLKGGKVVGVLAAGVVQKLLAGPLTYRDHALAKAGDPDAVRLQAGERKATFSRPEGSWKLTDPLPAEADHDALEAFVLSLSRLRADELVAEKPSAAQLKGFGLDKPVARWQFLKGDKVELDLSVGAAGKGGRRYAQLGGKGLVFLLDPKLSAQALAEYRTRAVFKENIDPAQVEAVRFGYRKGPFELKKVNGAWEVAGQPGVKLNLPAVNDALAVLRDLKAERYVKDAGAQLKLFGLDPPELVLTVTTPAGAQTLHVGGLEGTSRRRYARRPARDRGDVFVLDEQASAKLVRDLPGFSVGRK